MLPTAFKMAPKSFKIEARRAQNHPATPLGLARLPQTTPDPPQTSIWTDFGFDFNEFCTQNGRPETEKTKQSEVFSSSFRLRWKKDCDAFTIRLRRSCCFSLCSFYRCCCQHAVKKRGGFSPLSLHLVYIYIYIYLFHIICNRSTQPITRAESPFCSR